MRVAIVSSAVLACAFLAISATPSHAGKVVAKTGGKWQAFDAYPRARQLCSEHVTGNTMHIEWQSYASADTPAQVKAFYTQRMADKVTESGGTFTVRATADLLMTVHAAGTDHPTCAEAPKKTEQTVIVVSLAIR